MWSCTCNGVGASLASCSLSAPKGAQLSIVSSCMVRAFVCLFWWLWRQVCNHHDHHAQDVQQVQVLEISYRIRVALGGWPGQAKPGRQQ